MRISNLYIKQSSVQNTNKNTQKMVRTQNQLITSKKNLAPSDDPGALITSIYHRVRINQIDQYQENISATQSYVNVAHDKISTVSEVVRRIRELAIQAANGPLNNSDRVNMAVELEQHLQQVIELANSQYKDNFLFAGTKTGTKPFLANTTFNNALGMEVVDQVQYLGDGLALKREIDFNKEVSLNNSGARVFWAQNHTVVSTLEAENYISPRDQRIAIDGYTVDVLTGDDLSTIVEKINANVPTAKAFVEELETGGKSLGLEANFPHQMAIEDHEGGTLLRELGILQAGARGDEPFSNISESTIVQNGSIFEAIVRLRDSIINDQLANISGRDLGALTKGYRSIIENQAKISSTQSYLDTTSKDLSVEKLHSVERKSQVEDVNIMEASVEYNQLSNVHRISLQTAARLIQPTLLDFL